MRPVESGGAPGDWGTGREAHSSRNRMQWMSEEQNFVRETDRERGESFEEYLRQGLDHGVEEGSHSYSHL